MRRHVGFIILLAFAALATLPAAARREPDIQTQRLAKLGKVWLTTKFAHPRVALTDRDWDGALVSALPGVKAATDDKSFAEAIGAMLVTLDDPVTRVVNPGEPGAGGSQASPAGSGIKIAASPDGALILDMRAPGTPVDFAAIQKTITANLDAITKAERMIVDLRGTRATGTQLVSMLQAFLISHPITLPATRHVLHSGYRAQVGGAAFYNSQYTIDAATTVLPRPGLGPRRVAFVLDRTVTVPVLAMALQAEGSGAIVVVGQAPLMPVSVLSIALGGGSYAVIRASDLVCNGRRIDARPDATLEANEPDDRVYIQASGLIATARPPSPGVEDLSPLWKPEAGYADESCPSEAHRLLAVFRLWGVFDYFFPYKHLLDKPWDDVLEEFIPRVLAVQNELEYAQTMAQMAARGQDSHIGITGSRALSKWLGEMPPPVFIRFIEGKPIVTRILDDKAAAGLRVGDEIVTVDGEQAGARGLRLEQYLAFSTPAGRDRTVESRMLSGDPGSTARLAVRGADAAVREVSVQRPERATPAAQRDGEVVRLLDGNIGYADLDRLEVADVPQMFARFRNAVGIIFDMRGYPRSTAWAIAPRINTRKPSAAALFFRPLLEAGSTTNRLTFLQPLPPTTTWVYERPTVMLIDERTISQAEHTGLFFKAANGTTFIGSPTTGANGDVTSTVLPGGLRVSFTGHDVRYPDGRQLQRVGLIPDVEVKPTIAGIRAGRDEVLERAVKYLTGTMKSPEE
ncbi:MAG: hypothetical protein LAP85_16740 [Acidobacteriia bacterium]|nr:hypothetical protein [Terriglobia bacterium]